MNEVPDGLVVEVDDAGMHVELGPPPPRMITIATVASVIVVVLLVMLAGVFDLVAIQILLLTIGVFGVAALRMIEFGRNEAALTLTADERALTLTRHYRGRVFRRDRYPLDRIAGCAAIIDGLKLDLPGGAKWLKTRFRSAEQNQWVADMVNNALERHRTHDTARQIEDTADIDVLVGQAPYRT